MSNTQNSQEDRPLHDELHRLHQQAGCPSADELQKHARNSGHPGSKQTFRNLLNGKGTPKTETVEAFVSACARHAEKRRPPLRLAPELVDLDRWRARYRATYPAVAAPPTGDSGDMAFVTARREYGKRLRERYGRIDLEALMPLTEQGEHPPVGLREVFTAQAVRADPPPVELPKELIRRLVEAGELGKDELPDGVDPELLAGIRQTYQERPAQPVLRVLAELGRQRLVLLGDPGAGKSTLARYLALALTEPTVTEPLAALAGWLPVLVELRTYAEARWRERTFLDLIDHLHTTERLGLPGPALDTFLRQAGRAVVIFDGLDELFDPQLRETVARQIAGFAARYPQARIVVTSRVIGYQRAVLDGAGFTHFMLQDLDAGQVEAFVNRWYQLACPDNPPEAARLRERLLAAVGDSAAVRELAGNPMLLTILSIIGRRRELPRERRTVYEHAVDVLVEHWDPSRHLRDTRVDQGMPYIDRVDKLELLRLVARRMQDGPAGLAGNHIPGPELVAEFDTYLRDRYTLPPDRAKPAAKAMLEQFRERNFILSRFGAGVYGFVHRAFLEYLAATDIVTRFNARELTEDQLISDVFGRRWPDPAWEEVLLLITGMLPERFAGQIIDHLLAADPLWFLRPRELPGHIFLAVRCLGEVRKLGMLSTQSRAITDAVISLLETAHERVEQYDSSLTEAIEQAVLPAFTVIGPQGAGRRRYQDWYLLRGQFLVTPSEVSAQVVSLAARIGAALLRDDHDFHQELQTQAVGSPHGAVRVAAVQAVAAGWREDPGTLPWLRERVTQDPDANVREMVGQMLAAGWNEDVRDRAVTSVDGCGLGESDGEPVRAGDDDDSGA
ncbi:MAG: NACHT domain-containing protein [Pseudonocardiaceae bacterium]